jgi:hypothetical protein
MFITGRSIVTAAKVITASIIKVPAIIVIIIVFQRSAAVVLLLLLVAVLLISIVTGCSLKVL